MSRITIESAMGHAPEMEIEAAQLTDLGTLDTNRVHVIAPNGPQVTIESFGVGDQSKLVTKRVRFDAGIKVKHSNSLRLMTSADRVTGGGDVGTYTANEISEWEEEDYQYKPVTQYFYESATITIPSPFRSAFARVCGLGGSRSTVGASGSGGYTEKLLVNINPGRTLSLTIPSIVAGMTFTTDPVTLVSSWGTGSGTSFVADHYLSAGGGTAGIGALPGQGGTGSGGDRNVTGGSGLYSAGVFASVGASEMSPEHRIDAPTPWARGIDFGGGALVLSATNMPDTVTIMGTPTPCVFGGRGVCIIEWRL